MDIPLWTTVTSLILVVATGIFLSLLHRRRQHGFFRKYGIPGPEPDLLSGNYMQLKKDRIEVMEGWIKRYGKVFGFYLGERPYMVVTDLDIIKECFLKETNNFYNRPNIFLDFEPFRSSLIALSGFEWKKVRSALNPSFSASKMKMMTHIMSQCVEEMLEVLREHAERGEAVNMLDVSQGLTLDVIAKCALAWQVECQRNVTDPMLRAVRKVLLDLESVLVDGLVCFPPLRQAIEWLYPYSSYHDVTKQITDNLSKVIDLRRKKQGPRPTDMLQLMLNAQEDHQNATSAHLGENTFFIRDRHLMANSFIFLVAGFETTATALAFVMHTLAKYPDEQDRVFRELTEVFPEKSQTLTYDGVQQLKRLDMVIREVLRLYPPVVLFVGRVCRQDTSVMGQFFPAGANVLVPTWHMHHNPDVWEDPNTFNPERFSEGKSAHHPAAYLPFGMGPRVCIGERFALLELKLVICHVLRRYRVTTSNRTNDPMKIAVTSVVIRPKECIEVKLELR